MLPLPHYGDKSSGFSLSRTSEDMDGTLQLIFKIFIIVFNINKGMGNIFLSHALGLNFAMLKKVLHTIKICPIVTILFLGHHVGVSVPPQEHGQYWEFRSYLKRSLLHSNLCTLEQTRKCGFCICVNMLSSSRRTFFLTLFSVHWFNLAKNWKATASSIDGWCTDKGETWLKRWW